MNIRTIQGSGYTAKINLSLGANCISLRNEKYGAVILREPDYSCELDNPYIYGMPILFPANRISNGYFDFEGRRYQFPVNEIETGCHVHGTLHQEEFDLVELTDNRIVCCFSAEKNQYLDFPHEFEIKITYELSEKGLKQTTEVTNRSSTNMPCLIGFHTTFNLLFLDRNKKDGIEIFADISREYERSKKNYLPVEIKHNFDEVSEQISIGKFNPFSSPVSRHYRINDEGLMQISDTENKLKVVYENSKNLGYRLILTDGNEYICMEPQNCLVDSPNSIFGRDEAGFEYIEPGKSKKYFSKIYLSELK